MFNKLLVTQHLLDMYQASEWPVDYWPSLEQAMKTWWSNIREHGGLRLTTEGYNVCNHVDIASYEFTVPETLPTTPRHLLALDQKLTCPYYIKVGKNPKLLMFGSQEAVMFALYGDVEKFITSLKHS